MKKLITVFVILAMVLQTWGQTESLGSIASLPFSGTAASLDEKEYFAELFAGELVMAGYTLVTRTSAQSMLNVESNYQRSGATADAAEIGKQLKADYVLAGTIRKVMDSYAVTAQLIDVQSAQLRSSDTRTVETLAEITSILIKDMVSKINAQITGGKYVAQTEQTLNRLNQNLQEELKVFKRNKWIGRGIWIGGLVTSTIGGIMIIPRTIPNEPATEWIIEETYNGYRQYYGVDPEKQAAYLKAVRASEIQRDTGAILAIAGGALVVGGVITDIIFSVRESKLKKSMQAQGLVFNFTPLVTPTSAGTFNYGGQLTLKYEY